MTNWDYSGGYDGATHPDVGTYADESVADTPEVERYDPQLDPDLADKVDGMRTPVRFEVHNCPACGIELCRTSTRDSWSKSIGIMEDAMDAHLPDCGPSNTPEVNAAAQRVVDILRGDPR